MPIYGGTKFITNQQTDKQTEKMKTADTISGLKNEADIHIFCEAHLGASAHER